MLVQSEQFIAEHDLDITEVGNVRYSVHESRQMKV